MRFTGKATPHFSARNIFNETIRRDWFQFQSDAFELGLSLTGYIQNYISARRKRRGGTGKLERSISFETIATSPAIVGWGIGNINVLNQRAKYWYVVNYGAMVGGQPFVPARGKFVPGSFEGNPPNSALKGGVQKFNYKDGSNMGIFPKSPIRPLNYIQAGRRKMSARLRAIVIKLKKGL